MADAGIMTTRDLGETTSIEVVRSLVPLNGQSVMDIGCGDMTFSRQLAGLGAQVLAIDPDARQADTNRAALEAAPGDAPDLDFVEAGAERLPVMDASMDGVYFSFSLHHVPAQLYPEVFAEVSRVLKPGGHLCVIEPIGGPLNDVMMMFHDEEHERAEAQRALVTFAVPSFESCEAVRYHSPIQYESFDAMVKRYSSRTFNPDYSEADIRRPDVEAAFERLGAPDYRFESPKKLVFFWGSLGE